MTYRVVTGKIERFCEHYRGEPFHAVLCDAPYGMSNKTIEGINNSIVRGLFNIMLPSLAEFDAEGVKNIDLFGIPLDGSPLSRKKISMIIESGISVPECTINLDCDLEDRQEKVEAGTVSASSGISDKVLMDKVDSKSPKFIGNYVLDFRNTIDLASRNILSSGFSEFGSGAFSVPVSLLFPDFGNLSLSDFSQSLSFFLKSSAPGFADFVGLPDDSLSKPKSSSDIVTRGRAINTLMLRFDLTRRTIELFATHRAQEYISSSQLGCPQLIRASATTSSLPAPFKPTRVRVVINTTDRTRSMYFHLILRENFWDELESVLPQGGFMGKEWDACVPDVETWASISNLLHPGAFLLVFAGTINDDLISIAMRKAGLRKLHKCLGWSYGSGFCKATRIDTQIDQAAGVEREKVGRRPWSNAKMKAGQGISGLQQAGSFAGDYKGERVNVPITAPATPLAQAWEGHRYGGQVLKPAIETILVFQKPYDSCPVDCITETGAGALNIEAARIGVDTISTHSRGNNQAFPKRPCETTIEESGRKTRQDLIDTDSERKGRWPANFYARHHPECVSVGTKKVKTGTAVRRNKGTTPSSFLAQDDGPKPDYGHADRDGLETITNWQCHPDCPVRKLGEQSGERQSGGYPPEGGQRSHNVTYGEPNKRGEQKFTHSSGTAARFFFQSHWMYERLEQENPILYCPKATRKERDAGCDSIPTRTRNRVNPGGLENEPRFAPVKAKNIHPTVKPIALAKWLATLLLPPEEYAPRRLLVPFAGSGSEMIGALLAGWEEIIGVELLEENIAIARARIAWWQKWVEMGCDDVSVILREGIALEKDTPPEQTRMFE